MSRILTMLGLVVAGEAVFALPFHVARFFRPTVLEAFHLTNTELGAGQSVYGVIAMIAYFFGGPLADRFSARKLLAASLTATAGGGVYMTTFPGRLGMALLFGYWGATTILLFWAALIRATRDWGGHDEQGRAFGILDGGRGLVAALLASAGVLAFRIVFPEDAATATPEEQRQALRAVIYTYAAVALAAAALVWFVVPDHDLESNAVPGRNPRAVVADLLRVVRIPSVWLQALIVICAYAGYKGFDNYSLFAVEGYGMDEVEAAQVSAVGVWIRPVAPVLAGLLGDRVRSSRVIIGGFVVLVASDLYFALTAPVPSMAWILVGNILLACVAIFGLRGVYFALFEEAQVPMAVTGTTVGLVSVFGYTPDAFVNLTQGLLLDAHPGLLGHQLFFLFLAAFAALGVVTAILFERLNRRSA